MRISLEGKKLCVTGDTRMLKAINASVPGTNLSKDKTMLRSKLDEIVYLQMKQQLKGQDYVIDQAVKDWARAEKQYSVTVSQIKNSYDQDIGLSYQDKLRRYQRVDVAAMRFMRRMILGNEPGTGKTLESIAYCDSINARKILVVCSKPLINTWCTEIDKWSSNPSYQDVPVDSFYKRKEKMKENLQTDTRFKIVNYEMLRDNTFNELWDTKWDVVICDEAHKLKGRNSKVSDGAEKLKSESLILATGTWINNNHHEVFQLLKLIDPKRFSAYWPFVERFCKTEESFFSKTPDIVGPKNIKGYKHMMNDYLIQRRKRDVLNELPDVIHKNVKITMTPTQKKLYNDIQNHMMATLGNDILLTPNASAQYQKMRQVLLSPATVGGKESSNKVQAIMDIIEEAEGQVIIFSWFKSFIKYLEYALDKQNHRYISIHGDVSNQNRYDSVAQFTANNSKIKVCLGTIKTMSEGLNLQTADTLIFADKSYVPGDNEQAIARVDRMGQENNPTVYHLITENTVEEHIENVLEEKQDLIDEASAIEEVLKRMS